MPMISIIVPVYNVENSLSQCIESIIRQKHANFELLLIDDGSTDGSGQVCDLFAEQDQRIRVFHQKNAGVSSARNLGLDNARGEWLTFVDSDDYIEADYFPNDFITEVDMYVQNWRVFGGGKAPHEHIAKQIVEDGLYSIFMEQYGYFDLFRFVAAKFVRRDVIEKYHIRFLTQFSLGEDTLFFMNYYKYCHKICVLDTGRYLYYKPNGGGKWDSKFKIEDVLAYEKVFWNQYRQLPFQCKQLLLFAVTWFLKTVENHDDMFVKLRWLYDPTIMAMRKSCKNNSTFKFFKFQVKNTLLILIGKEF